MKGREDGLHRGVRDTSVINYKLYKDAFYRAVAGSFKQHLKISRLALPRCWVSGSSCWLRKYLCFLSSEERKVKQNPSEKIYDTGFNDDEKLNFIKICDNLPASHIRGFPGVPQLLMST